MFSATGPSLWQSPYQTRFPRRTIGLPRKATTIGRICPSLRRRPSESYADASMETRPVGPEVCPEFRYIKIINPRNRRIVQARDNEQPSRRAGIVQSRDAM